MKKINILIDASNLCYRQFFILKEFSNSKGVPTGLYFGFLKAIYRLKEKYKPDEMVVVWDSKPTKKKELYPEYKQNRKKTEDHEQLFSQMATLKKILTIFNVGQVLVEGEEADDAISTLIHTKYKDQLNYIYTMDLDMAQLVDEQTLWLRPDKESRELILDKRATMDFILKKEKCELLPEKIPFFKTITGDSSDNIKGVDRFPKKLAAKICNHFDTIEDLKNNVLTAFQLTAKQREKFIKFIETEKIDINYEIIKLKKDLVIQDFEIPTYNRNKVERLFKELEFDSFLVIMDRFHSVFEGTKIDHTKPKVMSLF